MIGANSCVYWGLCWEKWDQKWWYEGEKLRWFRLCSDWKAAIWFHYNVSLLSNDWLLNAKKSLLRSFTIRFSISIKGFQQNNFDIMDFFVSQEPVSKLIPFCHILKKPVHCQMLRKQNLKKAFNQIFGIIYFTFLISQPRSCIWSHAHARTKKVALQWRRLSQASYRHRADSSTKQWKQLG